MIEGLNRVLVVGGGIGGMACAIRLRQEGIEVDLVDLDPEWRVYGAGITITGPTLRAYRALGLLDQIKAEGAVTNGTHLRHFSGAMIAELDEPSIEEGLPATGGILRPVLHRIMSDAVRQSGASVRLGLSVAALRPRPGGVDVDFTDGTAGAYDLVIGADGINSKVRALTFPDHVRPRYTGQSSWRVLADRPAGFDKGEFYLGHANMAGITACSPDKVYAFVLNSDTEKKRVDPPEQLDILRGLMADFGGNLGTIREGLGADSAIVYRPLEAAIQPKPWHVGRVVLVGDAAHATTPHLASGAGIAVEDALVLVEELAAHAPAIEAGLAAFTERRFERCKFVVETSVAIGDAQIAGDSAQAGKMTGQALHALAEPI